MLHIPPSRIAAALGLAGLAPFIVLAACLWFVAPIWQESFARALVAYGAVILGALGAIHWGAAIEGGDPQLLWRYLYGLCPVLLAWVAVLCPPGTGMFLLFAGLVAAFIVDRQVWRHLDWYVNPRAVLTVIACVCLYISYKAL